MKYLAIFFFLIFSGISFGQEMKVKLDGVKITFLADKQKTAGSISGLEAKIKFDMNDLSNSSITGTVEVDKLTTGNKKRDEHLKSSDYFHAEKYPTMSFTSQSFEKSGDGFIMKGVMQIKDFKKNETIEFKFSNNTFYGSTTIRSVDYGIFEKDKPEKSNVKITFVIPVE